MRLQFDRKVLEPELQSVQVITARKQTIPALSHVLLTRDADGGTHLAATDLNVAKRSTFDVVMGAAGDGAVLLPAAKFYELVQALPPGQDVTVETDGKTAHVTCGVFKSRLNVLPAEEFPTLPSTPTGGGVVPRALLREMVRKTRFAISSDDTRYYLNGSLLVITPTDMRMAATDGHRLALVIAQHVSDLKEHAIVPSNTLKELASVLDGDGDDVKLSRGDEHLFFETGRRLLISRLIDGQFPSYDKIIPTGFKLRAVMPRAKLAEAISRVAILADQRSRSVRFALSSGSLSITCTNVESGEAADKVDVEYPGPDIALSFNARYLLEFLNATDTEQVSVELRDEVSQALFRAIGTTGYDYAYVVMPMRT
jgi:DNA polymerase III subunit beta